MDGSDLYILKGNFVQFRTDNIVDNYEFWPKVLHSSSCRNLGVEPMGLFTKQEIS